MLKKKFAMLIAVVFTVFSCSSLLISVQAKESLQESNASVQYIHLNTHSGDDNNDGLSAEKSVRSFEKAKSLINDGDIILIDSYITITQDETWDLTDKPNSKIQRNTARNMIEIEGKHTLTLNHVVIDGTHYGGDNSNNLSIISLGKTAGKEENGATLILNKGTILENNNNNRLNGGAISGYSYNTVIMNENSIIRNNGISNPCADFGGAICLENHGQFIMNGGVIENNHAVRGGGVCLIASSMVMNGGEIKNNTANSSSGYLGHYGGGIYLSNYQDWASVGGDHSRDIAGPASLTINDGVISGNQATYRKGGDNGLGGAIATFPRYDVGYESDPVITIDINGGEIFGNEAVNGGAISAYFSAVQLDISNTEVYNNQALSQGGAIYGVFNTKINLTDTTIASNKAKIGGGIYLHSSEMNMNSGEISNNEAISNGGGIYIDNGVWNNKSAQCTLLGGIVKNNTANADKGSDGIYQNSKLNIGEKVLIDATNDVYLPANRVIDVIKPLENLTKQNRISVTSEECIVENKTDAGTPLVHYHAEAGGEKAAELAEQNQLYLPSQYMQNGLVIGKSQADSQLDYMTYIQKAKYPVVYEFVSGTHDKVLPEEVINLLPVDNEWYLEGVTVSAIQPNQATIQVPDGVWIFKGYDADNKVANADNANQDKTLKFVGTWEFSLNASIINHVPTINANDKTLTVGDEFDPYQDVTAMDEEDGNLTSNIEILNNTVDTSKAGTYEVTYKVTDSKGASTIKTIKVNVIEEGIMVDPDQSDHNQTSDKDKTEEIHNIETGDNTNLILLVVLLIGSTMILLYTVYRKNRN